MLITAKNLKTAVTELKATISFECSWKAKEALEKLKSGDYEISITKQNKKRTKAQNRYLWELLGQISMKENGNTADDFNIYCQLIEASGAKHEYMMVLADEKILERLRLVYRVVKILESRVYNGKRMWMLKCFYGSSQLDTKEMAMLIDKTIERAEMDGIDTEPWRERFNDTL